VKPTVTWCIPFRSVKPSEFNRSGDIVAFEDIKKGLKAAAEVTRSARNPVELLKMALPAEMRGRHLLNDGALAQDAPRGAEIAVALRGLRNRLKGDAYVVESGGVDYAKLAGSEAFAALEETSRALKLLRPEDLPTHEERLAFWINLYNVQVIHGVIALGIEKSVREIPSFFSTIAYQIGEEFFTPDAIEHGLLRMNTGHHSRHKTFFKEGDPRMAWMVDKLDPRIHVSLVCVSQGCPPIAFYDAERIEEQLTMAAEGFVNTGVEVDDDRGEIVTSSIFDWYGGDFGGEQGVLDFFIAHADPGLKESLEDARAKNYTMRFLPYDWSLNSL
jgi:hypothetical protein